MGGSWIRFIPARAGNVDEPEVKDAIPSVHPRSCGERTSSLLEYQNVNGSSPLVRGTSGNDHGRANWRRFIPARAGNVRLLT